MKDTSTSFYGEVRRGFRSGNSSKEMRVEAFDVGLDLGRKVIVGESKVEVRSWETEPKASARSNQVQ